ncbi:hypothetical protein EON80_20635 [bacterium]|nr:MAG: hypothetical protein EON80_20635 [bacterium]
MIQPIRAIPLLALLTFPAVTQAQTSKIGAVKIGEVSIEGLDEVAATRRLKRELAPKLDQRIGLALGSKIAYRKRSDLGYSLDITGMLAHAPKGVSNVPILFLVDDKLAANALRRLDDTLSSKSRDAKPILSDDSEVSIRPEIIGRSLDASQSAARLKIEAEQEPTKTRFVLAGKTLNPKITSAQLKGIDGELGRFTTRFNPGEVKRSTNMRVAIGSIDGTVIPTGGTFSLNKTVGERTSARGYKTAIIFEDGKKKPGLGGGVSQVTGTLFNAALYSSLPIVSYRTHSRPVAYLPLGRDATVAWGSFDMKFKNDTGAPIFISYKISGSRATAILFGRKTKIRSLCVSLRKGMGRAIFRRFSSAPFGKTEKSLKKRRWAPLIIFGRAIPRNKTLPHRSF